MLKRIWESPLRRDIAIALAIKAVLLLGLWYAFFRQPLDDRLTAEQVGAAILERQGHTQGDTPTLHKLNTKETR